MASVETIREQLDNIMNKVAETQNIANFEINLNTEANYGDGFVAQFYTGDIRDKDNGETTSVAIKKAPNFDLEFEYNEIFRNENLFYNTLLPALEELQKEMGILTPFDNFPKYFCSSIELKQEYIAMENLKPFGYVMFDKKQYLGKDHLEEIFKIYGKFHALSFALRKKDLEKCKEISNEFFDITTQLAKFLGKPMISSICAAVNALDSEDDKIVHDELKDFGENAIKLFLASCRYNGDYRCLIHGDCWSNNMLFKYSESGELLDIKLIDFQLCQDGSPIYDLSYFFYSGASKQDFDNLDKYLEIYHNSLSQFTKELDVNHGELFSFDTLKNEWKENALFGVIMGIYLWQVKLIPKEKLTDIINPDQEQKTTLEESIKYWEMLMGKVYKTDEYRERTTAILRHAFEYGVLKRSKLEEIINK